MMTTERVNAISKAAFEMPSLRRLGRAYVAGINPLGTTTVELGRETPEPTYAPMQAAGVLGGLTGGGILIPGATTGAIAAYNAMKANAIAGPGRKTSLTKAFLQGAVDPFKTLYRSAQGYKHLSRLAHRGVQMPPAIERNLTDILAKNMTLQQAAEAAKGISNVPVDLPSTLGPHALTTAPGKKQLADAAKQHIRSPQAARTLLPALRSKIIGGVTLLGVPALLAAYAAYKQYKMGQRLRRERRQGGLLPQSWFGR